MVYIPQTQLPNIDVKDDYYSSHDVQRKIIRIRRPLSNPENMLW